MTYNELQAMTHEELVNTALRLEDCLETTKQHFDSIKMEHELLLKKHRVLRETVSNLVLLTE